ncbi:MAG: hypothetical protein HYY01_13710 [Chloroflexi bacterium]|nr:hypothetical protein [Chloroflexota bacterium]
MLARRKRRGWGEVGEAGQVLLLAVVLLAAGMVVLVPLLSQIATMLQKGGNEREQRMKVLAAEAALNRVVSDLVRGADAVSTTYNTTSPHRPGRPHQEFFVTTSYAPPSVTTNDYTPTVALSLPTPGQTKPTAQHEYVDPGTVHPYLATVPANKGYLMRLYNVKAGTIQVNWAYNEEGKSKVGIWAGIPLDNGNDPLPPGRINVWPQSASLEENQVNKAYFNRTLGVTVDPATDDSGGVYTIVFFNVDNQTKTTVAFSPSGGPEHTWTYAKAYKDYLVTASVGAVSVSAYLRQVPGFSEPPDYTSPWATDNVSFITNQVFAYTWLSP